MPIRFTLILTNELLGPRSEPVTSAFLIFLPATILPFTFIILSPALIPNFSDGPPGITDTMYMVSFTIKNSTPMPSKLPSKSSFDFFTSSAGIYTLCGSSCESIPSMVSLSNFFKSTESTYFLSTRLKT